MQEIIKEQIDEQLAQEVEFVPLVRLFDNLHLLDALPRRQGKTAGGIGRYLCVAVALTTPALLLHFYIYMYIMYIHM